MICEGFNFTKRASGMFDCCVRTGSYGLRECAASVGSILDIGANVGFFSVAARILCPDAQVVSMEPDVRIYPQLLKNCDHLRIQPVNVGLGNGQPLRLFEKHARERHCYGTRFDVDGNGVTIPSVSIAKVVSAFGLKSLFIKIDCEGAEKYLMGDKESEDIIRDCVGIGGEFHSVANRMSDSEAWLKSLLGESHKITYMRQIKGTREFRAIRNTISKPQLSGGFPNRGVRFLRTVTQNRGNTTYGKNQVYKLTHDAASHYVCLGYCEYAF